MSAPTLGILLFLYPFLAFGGLLITCWVCGRKIGSTSGKRPYRIFKIATLATIVFTPAGFGTIGFGFFVPWVVKIFAPSDTIIMWPLAIPIFIVALFITYVSTSPEKRD